MTASPRPPEVLSWRQSKRSSSLWKTLDKALRHVKQREEAAIEDDRSEKPLQHQLDLPKNHNAIGCPGCGRRGCAVLAPKHKRSGLSNQAPMQPRNGSSPTRTRSSSRNSGDTLRARGRRVCEVRLGVTPIDQVEAQLQSAVLAAAQVSLLNSAQARQISIFTCVTLAVFCLAPRRPIKALFVASTGSARDISHLGVIFKTIFRRGQTSTKD
jgi:hypothetical protein